MEIFMTYIWSGMIIASLVMGFFNGSLEATVNAAFAGAQGAVETLLPLGGMLCLWSGFLRLAELGGVSAVLHRVLRPVVSLLFPRLKGRTEITEPITVNMTANLLGMGNAATPPGIRAMTELDRLNGCVPVPSDEMCMLIAVNTSSLQLIPSTVMALRAAYGSQNPAEIILPVWITSLAALTASVLLLKILCCLRRLKRSNG